MNLGAFQTTLSLEETNEGNNFIYGVALVTTTRHSGQFTWGRELAVNLFVRPIPRQLWPTKDEDAGADWVTNEYPGLGNLTTDDWLNAVGWLPLSGSSAISIRTSLASSVGVRCWSYIWLAEDSHSCVLVVYLVAACGICFTSRR